MSPQPIETTMSPSRASRATKSIKSSRRGSQTTRFVGSASVTAFTISLPVTPGIGVVPESVGDATPGVRRALPDLAPLVLPIWLTTHREVRTSRRVRLVFDMLAKALAP